MQRGRDLIAKHARTSDCVITTAQVPGRPAPLLLTEEAVAGMRRGSVVVDLAGATGGNCALSRPGEDVESSNGVTIMTPLNLPATVPVHASQLYSRNATSFLGLLVKDGRLNVDLTDDVVGPSCVTHNGAVVNPRVSAALEAAKKQ
jgi:NAD(P) transhydrogenase subunit alpha